MATSQQTIRNIVVGLLVRDGHVLGEEYPPRKGYHRYVRAVGGGIRFRERAEDAIRRQFREELEVEIETAEKLGVVENIFDLLDERNHEIAHVFGVTCPALVDDLPLKDWREVVDTVSTVGWYPLDRLSDGPGEGLPFYPAGVLDLAREWAERS